MDKINPENHHTEPEDVEDTTVLEAAIILARWADYTGQDFLIGSRRNSD